MMRITYSRGGNREELMVTSAYLSYDSEETSTYKRDE
jgi:hypothetical protein